VEIIPFDSTTQVLCRRDAAEMITRWDGSRYLSHNHSPLFIRAKSEVKIIEDV